PPNMPFVGSHFNMTQAGIHADGMLKDEEIYNIFDTTTLLKSPPGVSITQTSGQAGIAMWLANHLHVPNQDISKNDERVVKLKKWVDEQYATGRVTTIGQEELEDACRQLNDC
ncbi:MAG: 2-isopropylmalate synthase, partial [Firmicutes bacterium]|nr:2-isopropylmalate synthase [Bacillota bacterium]